MNVLELKLIMRKTQTNVNHLEEKKKQLQPKHSDAVLWIEFGGTFLFCFTFISESFS